MSALTLLLESINLQALLELEAATLSSKLDACQSKLEEALQEATESRWLLISR